MHLEESRDTRTRGAEHVWGEEKKGDADIKSHLGGNRERLCAWPAGFTVSVGLFKIKLFCFSSKYKLSETADIFSL